MPNDDHNCVLGIENSSEHSALNVQMVSLTLMLI